MKFIDFLEELDQKEIKISIISGRIQYSGPEHNISTSLIEKIKEFREDLIRHFWPSECKDLILYKSGVNKLPIVLVHGMNMGYLLGRYIKNDQPLYGFFDDVTIGNELKHKNVESIANNYLKQLKVILPNGPYILVGYCFGGIIAYEMVDQLKKSGDEVSLLAFIESFNPYIFKLVNWTSNVIFYRKLSRSLIKMIWSNFKLILYNCFFLVKTTLPESLKDDYVNCYYSNLTLNYFPERKDIDLLLYRIKMSQVPVFKSDYGWSELVNHVTVVPLEGDHMTINRTHKNAEIIFNEIERSLIKTEKSE